MIVFSNLQPRMKECENKINETTIIYQKGIFKLLIRHFKNEHEVLKKE